MNILWFVPPFDVHDGVISSPVASARLRAILPAKEMLKQQSGLGIRLIPLMNGTNITEEVLQETDVAIFGKVLQRFPGLSRALKERNIRVIVDLCDDVFSLQHLRTIYQELLADADHLVCSTPKLAELIETTLQRTATVIPDCVEGERLPVKKLENYLSSRISLLWFGHELHLEKTVGPLIPRLNEVDRATVEFTIVTGQSAATDSWLSQVRETAPFNVTLRMEPWSIAAMKAAYRSADIVVIPGLSDEQYHVKSPNRLVESLVAGVPVSAYTIPSYMEFSDFAVITDDVIDGVNRILRSPATYLQRLEHGQQVILASLSPRAIASKWLDMVAAVMAEQPSAVTRQGQGTALGRPIRLNLGCGDKSLPGYINVDVVDERSGNRPDVVCDIRNLAAFESNYADEILSVHVIEHFYYWEVKSLLQDWIRVLKPGGTLITECPNLLAACQEIVNNPEGTTYADARGQTTMWVFYGDPAWKDPLMCHRWLYTPQSLARLLAECGLVNIRQEPAQFKLGEPRDMRICADKPSL